MKQTAGRILLTVAAATLAFSPIAAQANTRAGDYSTTYSDSLGNFGALWSAEDFWFGEEKEAGVWKYALLGGAAVIVGIIILSSGGNGDSPIVNQSPGAN